MPLLVDGQRTSISGAFVRIPRPAFWPWALGAAVVVGLAAVAVQRAPHRRLAITVGSGVLAGVAGLTAQTSFALRDAPSGRSGWALIVAAFAIAVVTLGLLVAMNGVRRAYIAGTIGIGVAVICLSWLGVFFHGAVISALPAQATRVVCAVAFSTGLISLLGVLRIEA